ncbi:MULTISPECIES: carbon storage regulator CsrA [Brevibacillus]|uniref:carbon storage regulator CsrA n=1 Tax=Brevibacillus TaxID=55080 RepID=UPI00286FE24A|nr:MULTISPECIES: carbon storage regulator CsrA [Brevibacillus]MDR9506584.1 carbon storage regulator CsrA [Brevibacillus agri]
MLVLKRKLGESVVINDTITVKIVAIEGDTVKLGIEAPKDIRIFREELYNSIKKENEGAVASASEWNLEEVNLLLSKKDV